MDLLLASAAPADVTAEIARRLTQGGHRVTEHCELTDTDAVVALVSDDLDPAGLVRLMEVLTEARKDDVRIVAMTDRPPEKHPAAIAALGLGDAWIRLDEGADEEIALRIRRLSAASTTVAVTPIVVGADQPAGEGSRKVVFLSYSSRDKKAASEIIAELRRPELDFWVDTDAITGGERWRASIERGIRRCDVMVVLLSPNVIRHPKEVEAELGLAQSAGKPIIPVMLDRLVPLPDGFGLMLSGTQMIKFFPDYGAGLAKLIDAIGAGQATPVPTGIFSRLRKRGREARRYAQQHDLLGKAAIVGAAVLATAGAMATAHAKAERERDAATDAELSRQQIAARLAYARRTDRLLASGINELREAPTMQPLEYRREVKPKIMRILGSLESGRPDGADPTFVDRHDRLVNDLHHLVSEFDKYFDKVERGETDGMEHTVRRLTDAWADTVMSGVEWMKEVNGSAGAGPDREDQA